MAVLRRCQESDREELNYWKRRYNENTEMRKTGSEMVSRQHSPGGTDSLSNGKGRVSLQLARKAFYIYNVFVVFFIFEAFSILLWKENGARL